jgi:hypothetical protein
MVVQQNEKRKQYMSRLNGTYKNANTGATLTITEANDSNGQLKGSIAYPDITLAVSGHYHFQNSVGPRTVIQLAALNDGARYEAWALVADDMNFTTLRSMGGRASFDGSLAGEGGAFARV